MVDPTAYLITLASARVPATDGAPRDATGRTETPTGPHAIIHGGAPIPTRQSLDRTHLQTQHWWQVICVSNNPDGARRVVDALTRAVDGQPHPDHPACYYRVSHASGPIEDRDDPTEWRWSSTVDVTLYIGR